MRLWQPDLSLRAQLLALGAVFTACFLGLGVVAVQRYADGDRQVREAELLSHAEALANAASQEVRAIRGALIGLASSSALESGDHAALYASATRAAAELGDDIGFSLLTADSHLFNTRLPYGPRLAFHPGPANVAIETGREVVSDPFFSPSLRRSIVIVSRPVRTGDASSPHYALNAFFPADRLDAVLKTAGIQPLWVAALFDSKGAQIACQSEPDVCKRAAKRAAIERTRLGNGADGRVIAHQEERSARLTAIHAVPETGWVALVGRPDETSVWTFLAGPARSLAAAAAALLAAGLCAAYFISRRILRPLQELGVAADALGGDADLSLPLAKRVAETRGIARALELSQSRVRSAAEELESRVRERTHQLEVQAEALRQARRDADAANAAKGRFLAQMTH
jgi:HAMP domain-containing protein